jgi:hypothetical protein
MRHRQTKEPANGYALPKPPRRTSTLLAKMPFWTAARERAYVGFELQKRLFAGPAAGHRE